MLCSLLLRSVLAAALVSAFVGCIRQPAQNAVDPSIFESVGDRPGRELPGLVGQPLDIVTAHYGAPSGDSQKTYTRGMGLYEEESGAGAAILDTLREGTSAEVRWLNWENPNRAVWAAQRGDRWIVVSAMEWDDNVQF